MLVKTVLAAGLLFAMGVPAAPGAAGTSVLVSGLIVEREGFERKAALLEQGIPIRPMPLAAVRELRLVGAPGWVEPEAYNERGEVSWLRVTALVRVGPRGQVPVRIERGASQVPEIELQELRDRIVVRTPHYELVLRQPGHIRLTAGGRELLNGVWSVELVGDARAILWGTYLREFVPDSIAVEDRSPHRATLLLKGRYTKNYRKQRMVEEPGKRFDCDLRLHVNAISPHIRFHWRLTNLTGNKTWLQRYALKLPLGGDGPQLLATANFLDDLGPGAGVRRSDDGRFLLHGGLDMPHDGPLLEGPAPRVWRQFHDGMSRTFEGTLITNGSETDALEETGALDLVLPAQYYSDVGALPEEGDPVTFGEWRQAVERSAEWLLRHQWRGTLWWGEWYREWDVTRSMGVQDTANGNSSLAPLYHYWRTGDGRFLACAKRAAQFTYDIQLCKSERPPGWMFHTRRNLFDELRWIHPRYQRAKGALVTSHVILYPWARREVIETIRNFYRKIFDDQGIPRGWDTEHNRRSDDPDGVDTSNFMEALVFCYRETGDREFLEGALRMSRWTAERWRQRHATPQDNWNWNLSQYALRGLVSLYQATGDAIARDTAVDIVRVTLNNKSPRTSVVQDAMGGRKVDNAFYHAWITAAVTRFATQGQSLLEELYQVVRSDVACQREDGSFLLDHGPEAGLPTRWTSFYDAKSLVAYLPVLAARRAALGLPPSPEPAVCGGLWFE
jgi:hypothetical protein